MSDMSELIACLDDDALEQLVDALAPRLAEALAPELARVVAGLAETQQPEPWITTRETARRYGLTADYTYRHADELGARRLGTGKKARLRFNPRTVERALSARVDGERSHPDASSRPAAKAPPARR